MKRRRRTKRCKSVKANPKDIKSAEQSIKLALSHAKQAYKELGIATSVLRAVDPKLQRKGKAADGLLRKVMGLMVAIEADLGYLQRGFPSV
jgi:hypothetical protein